MKFEVIDKDFVEHDFLSKRMPDVFWSLCQLMQSRHMGYEELDISGRVPAADLRR